MIELSTAEHHNQFPMRRNANVCCVSFLNFLSTKSEISKISTKKNSNMQVFPLNGVEVQKTKLIFTKIMFAFICF